MIPYADENPAPGNHKPVLALVILNLVAYAAMSREPERMISFAFVPAEPRFYTWISSQFLHAGVGHLLGNMWALWLFGDNVAARLGRWFVPFYLSGGAAADFLHYLMDPRSRIPSLGASGAIYAVIGAYVLLFPRARMKCFSLWYSYSLSALLFGIIYLLQDLLGALQSEAGRGGTAHWAHLGGLAFGAAWGLWLKADGQEQAVGLSGVSGSAPAAPAFDYGPTLAALKAGDEEGAVHHYLDASHRDRYFELPDAQAQLDVALKLARLGHAHLSREALQRFLLRHPGHALEPNALLLLGYLERVWFKELDAALKCYARAEAHPACPPELREDARRRRDEARQALDKNEPDPAAHNEACLLLFEGTPPLSAAQRRTVARVLETSPGPRNGVLAIGLPGTKAAALAARLEREGVPVLILPEKRRLRLPEARTVPALQWDESSLTLPGRAGPERVAWPRCLLIAALSVSETRLEKEEGGLFAVDVGDSRGMREVSQQVPRLEILTLDERRYRWSAPPEDPAAFFTAARGLVAAAFQVPVDGGARAAFAGELPETFCFPDPAQGEAYLFWQAQLARLKRGKAYA